MLEQLRRQGFERATLCVRHQHEKIRRAISEAGDIGIVVSFVLEEYPLGTAGPLGLLPRWDEPVLVLNADLLTDFNYQQLLTSHNDTGACFTIGTRIHDMQSEFGLVERIDGSVAAIWEKPTIGLEVLAGVYAASPSVRHLIDGRLEMPDLIQRLLIAGQMVDSYQGSTSWYDIGTPASLAEARAAFEANPERFMQPSECTDGVAAMRSGPKVASPGLRPRLAMIGAAHNE